MHNEGRYLKTLQKLQAPLYKSKLTGHQLVCSRKTLDGQAPLSPHEGKPAALAKIASLAQGDSWEGCLGCVKLVM
jgi:hypothetical protein